MSNVPPLHEQDLALVAAWPARPDTPRQLADQVAVLLRAITSVAPEISGWKRARAKAVASADDVTMLADMIQRGAVQDSGQPPVHLSAAGYLQWLYPVGGRGVQLMISGGQRAASATSTCVVQVEPGAPQLRTARAADTLLRAVVDAFDPQWATWTRSPLTDDRHATADGRALGYLNYGPEPGMRRLDPQASPYRRGAIAVLGADPEMADLRPIRAHLAAGGTGR